ncbi:uncharacterized protein LOC142338604 [Convolutriloba macropyga]|uniref:uncharacterized protein LOC142338604 n=1 Tax=Convolutriloba macropyga TaxID=536237 RepID=UPI003F5220A0
MMPSDYKVATFSVFVTVFCSRFVTVFTCPEDSFLVVDRCFLLYTQNRTWLDSDNYCLNSGGKLFEPRSAEELTYVFEHFNDQSNLIYPNSHSSEPRSFGGLWFWVGVVLASQPIIMKYHQLERLGEPKWRYVSNLVEIPKELWANDEPNGYDVGEYCGSVGSYENGLNDYDCSVMQGYICEYRAII